MRPTKSETNLRFRADQSLRCSHAECSRLWLSKMRPVKILIRLCRCAGWSESSLDAHTFCMEVHIMWQGSGNVQIPLFISKLNSSVYKLCFIHIHSRVVISFTCYYLKRNFNFIIVWIYRIVIYCHTEKNKMIIIKSACGLIWSHWHRSTTSSFIHTDQYRYLCKQCRSRWDGSLRDVSSRPTVCAILYIDFWQKTLLAIMGVYKFRDGRFHVRNSGLKSLTYLCEMYAA